MDTPGHAGHRADKGGAGHGASYLRLLLMVLLSFAAMYVLMYAMVDRWSNVHANHNQAYMAGLMAAPMLLVELSLMWRMYPRRGLNALLLAGGIALMAVCWWAIRQQVAIDDRQFLKSMIPHHAGALLMCRRNRLQDADLRQLCRAIVASQQREIELMQAELAER